MVLARVRMQADASMGLPLAAGKGIIVASMGRAAGMAVLSAAEVLTVNSYLGRVAPLWVENKPVLQGHQPAAADWM